MPLLPCHGGAFAFLAAGSSSESAVRSWASRPRFGAEVVIKFLAPTNPASRATPQRFAEYLLQPWYRSLLDWEQFRWEGEPTMLRNGKEAYQQVGVRASAGDDEKEGWVDGRRAAAEGNASELWLGFRQLQAMLAMSADLLDDAPTTTPGRKLT